jgi:hypothetical protein
MSDDDNAPWPPDGLPLEEAFWLIIGRQVEPDEAAHEFWHLMEQGELHLRFCDTVVKGPYRAKGHRGTPTWASAELSDIPASQWRYFAVFWMSQSMLVKHGSDVVWHGVRIWRAPPEQPAATGPKPGQQSQKGAMCEAAEVILAADDRRPAKGKGRLTAIAGMIHPGYPDYEISTIVRHIGQTVRDWEKKNPDK